MAEEKKVIALESNTYNAGTVERFKEHIPAVISDFFTREIEKMDIIPSMIVHPIWKQLVAEFGIDDDNEDEFIVVFGEVFDLMYEKVKKAAIIS